MISSFFDQTKPVNFLVLLAALVLLFWGVTFFDHGFDLEYSFVFQQLLASIALVLTLLLLGNMVKSMKLTLDNSFAMLFFLLLLLCFSNVLTDHKIIFCNFFLLMSTRSAIALKNDKNHNKKIFESALWLYVASFFNEWALLFIIPLFVAINLFTAKQLRLWLMPIAALICVAILATAVAMLLENTDFFQEHYRFHFLIDFFTKPDYLLGFYILVTFGAALLVFGRLGYRRLGRTLSLRLILVCLILSTLCTIATGGSQNNMEMLTFFPAAIFFTNYLEHLKKQKFKEIVLLICIVGSLLTFTIRLFQ